MNRDYEYINGTCRSCSLWAHSICHRDLVVRYGNELLCLWAREHGRGLPVSNTTDTFIDMGDVQETPTGGPQ